MIDCKSIVTEIKEELKGKVRKDNGLAIILVGDNVGSQLYVKGKIKDCEELGVPVTLYKYAEDEITQTQLEQLIEVLNHDDLTGGIIIQSPLPKKFDENKLVNMVADEKDVDGFKPTSKYTPATPKGIMTILHHVIPDGLDGLNVVLIGRGKTTNYPLIDLLLKENATLTICHSHSYPEDIKNACLHADVIVTAIGKPESLTVDMIRTGASAPIIIDVGISRINGKQVGDVSREVHSVAECTGWTQGTGILTRISLLQNLLGSR